MELLGKRSVAWWIKKLIDVIWILLLVVTAVTLVRSIVPLVAGGDWKVESRLNVRISFDPEQYAFSSSRMAIEGGAIKEASGKLSFVNARGPYALAVLSWTYLGLVIALVTIYQLRCVFDSLARRAAFEAANGRRLRMIALAIILGQVARGLLAFAVSRGVEQEMLAPGILLRPDWGVDPFSVLFGLILLVLAEVFRLGAQMKEEQDLTV